MDSKSKKITAMSIAVIVIFTSIAAVIIYVVSLPKPTEAESMILDPQDIGTDWNGWDQSSVNIEIYSNETSSIYRELQNTTIGIKDIVHVFDRENDSLAAYDKLNSELKSSSFYKNITFLTGDNAYFSFGDKVCYYEYDGFPHLNIQINRTMTVLWINDDNFCMKVWYEFALFEIAGLQADKIDQYLAQHPGAS